MIAPIRNRTLSDKHVSELLLYRELAQHYFSIEEVHRSFDAEIAFLVKHLPLPSYNRVVDLGCGSGEHSDELRQRGYIAVGIDVSQEMINVAKARFPKTRIIWDDMAKLSITGVYDAFISLFGTIDYLLDDIQLKKCFRSIHSRLRGGGRLIIDVWNAEPIRLIKKKPLSLVSSVICNGNVIHRNRGFTLIESSAKTLVKVDYLYQIDDQEFEDCHFMRAFFLQEIKEILRDSGFFQANAFSTFLNDNYSRNSNRLLLVADKDA